jgi:photosystem II stability/assembly factor-like uncharacterized protein
MVVALLVIANVILISVALLHHPTAAKQPVPVATNASHKSGPPRHSLTRVSSKSISAVSVAQPALASAWTNLRAWHAVRGCGATGNLVVTRDGGVTWSSVPLPAPHILAIKLTGPQAGWVVGADSSCHAAKYITTNGGRTWKTAATLGSSWVQIPTGVRRPNGSVSTPCRRSAPSPVILEAASAKRALAICSTGVYRTADGGAAWLPAGRVPKGRAAGAVLASNGHGALFLTKVPGCRGAQVVSTTDGGRSWTDGPCLLVAVPPLLGGIGPKGGGVLLSPGGVYTTTDYGAHWG